MSNRPAISQFRRRIQTGDHVLGTFIKFPSVHSTEIIGTVGFDFIIIDQEHSPFDRTTIDLLVLAARAVGTAPLVRISDPTPSAILSVLDLGATGILVPHVDSAAKARMVAEACRYKGGTRGFAHTTRAGTFAEVTIRQHIEQQDSEVTCIVMIEDMAAVEQIEEIAAVKGIDAFFVGRGDLTAALGAESMSDPKVREAAGRIVAAAKAAGIPIMVLHSDKADFEAMKAMGATAFAFASDQGFIKNAAKQAVADYGNKWR